MRPLRLRCWALVMKLFATTSHAPSSTDAFPNQLTDGPIDVLSLLFRQTKSVKNYIVKYLSVTQRIRFLLKYGDVRIRVDTAFHKHALYLSFEGYKQFLADLDYSDLTVIDRIHLQHTSSEGSTSGKFKEQPPNWMI